MNTETQKNIEALRERIRTECGETGELTLSDHAPSWTFTDDDGNGYTDCATALRNDRAGGIEVLWHGDRRKAGWEPLAWLDGEEGFDGLVEDLLTA